MRLKLIKGELIISNGLEMADAYLLGGLAATPSPALDRVKNAKKYKKVTKIKYGLNPISPMPSE